MKDLGGNPMWGEYFVYGVLFTNLAVGTGNQFTDAEVRIDSDADFAFCKTTYVTSNDNADVLLRYRDDSTGRYLTKSANVMRSIAGRALSLDNSGGFDFRPFIWPEPYYIRKSTSFMVQAANADAIITPTVYLTFHGYKVRPGLAPWKIKGLRMPYVYSLTRNAVANPEGAVTIAANQTVTAIISVDKDSDFMVSKINGGADGNCLITIQEMGRDRQWMNTGIHVRNLFGNGASPNILPQPRFIPKGATITVSIQDLSGAANVVFMDLIGTKIFSR